MQRQGKAAWFFFECSEELIVQTENRVREMTCVEFNNSRFEQVDSPISMVLNDEDEE